MDEAWITKAFDALNADNLSAAISPSTDSLKGTESGQVRFFNITTQDSLLADPYLEALNRAGMMDGLRVVGIVPVKNSIRIFFEDLSA